MLTVKECVPFLSLSRRTAAPLRAACVASPGEALSLSWIRALPGKKLVRYCHGQVFVIQRYLGFQLIRAHICHAQERPGEAPMINASSCDGLTSMGFHVSPSKTSQA
jgi:hypothetical protein